MLARSRHHVGIDPGQVENERRTRIFTAGWVVLSSTVPRLAPPPPSYAVLARARRYILADDGIWDESFVNVRLF
jgi:hypothetical protein